VAEARALGRDSPLPLHQRELRGAYGDAAGASAALRRCVERRLTSLPGGARARRAVVWRVLARPTHAAEGDAHGGGAPPPAAKLSREMQWRRDAALREQAPVVARVAATVYQEGQGRGAPLPLLRPAPPTYAAITPPVLETRDAVLLQGVRVASRALPPLRLRALGAAAAPGGWE
jgi:hypothetical protein